MCVIIKQRNMDQSEALSHTCFYSLFYFSSYFLLFLYLILFVVLLSRFLHSVVNEDLNEIKVNKCVYRYKVYYKCTYRESEL